MRILIFLIFLVSPLTVFAETDLFTCLNNSTLKANESKSALEKTQTAYSVVNNMTANFAQDSYLSALETAESSSGKLYFTKPGKMRWEYENPEEQVFLIVDTTLWFYQALDKQVVVDKFSKFLISDLPVAFILGIGDLGKSFEIQKSCVNASGKSIYFSLVPKKKSAKSESDDRLNKFELLVNKDTYLPEAAKIYDIASNVNTFYLKDMEINKAITEELYVAKFPDGTDIDDRRKEN